MTSVPGATNIESLQFINPEGLYDPRPNAYSHLAVFPAGWRVILPAGQGGENAEGVLPPDFASQLRQALSNTELVLAAAGATMADVAKFNLLIVDHDERKFADVRRIWQSTTTFRPNADLTSMPDRRLILTSGLLERGRYIGH